jgi:hypothetical protein
MRKIFYPANAPFYFTYNAQFLGHNYGLPIENPKDRETPLIFDKDGNALPTRIRRYAYADEYTYRI